ncbi:MAG TPA: hypothetical protein VFW11_03540 [Cyclobacteriaceae bacterium]|nr:hypothetical protein [Cyclobacteriaceae bacterium]
MTNERKKSIIILVSTLTIGIILGILIPGFFYKVNHRQLHSGQPRHEPPGKREWFVGTINRIVMPDSAQSRQIRPITAWAATEIDSIEQRANAQMGNVLDSVKSQLKPILTPGQWERLDKFDAEAKGRWNGRRRHR